MNRKEIYLVTDTHFNHKKLIEYGRSHDFEERVWDGLAEIPQGSTLIHLGDICIGKDSEVHNMLHYALSGTIRKILVRGNHDPKSNNWYLEHGWDFVCESFTDVLLGQKITFSHIPIKGIKHLNIHGHFHNSDHRRHEPGIRKYYDEKWHKLLAIELTDYKPVLLSKFISKK